MLASHHKSEQQGSYNVYAAALQELNKTREDLNVAKGTAANLEQLVVYFSITLDQMNPLLQGLLQHSGETRRSAEQLVGSIQLLTTIKQRFCVHIGR